jgi:hypothetical protein
MSWRSTDPYERVGWPNNGFAEGPIAYWDSFKREMWRFQLVAKVIRLSTRPQVGPLQIPQPSSRRAVVKVLPEFPQESRDVVDTGAGGLDQFEVAG